MSWRPRASLRLRLELLARLSALLEAGLPIPTALGVLSVDVRRRGDAARLQRAQRDVEAGADLSSALLARPALVDPSAGALVLAGERSGHLIDNLRTAARLGGSAAARRARLRSAAVYPLVVVSLALALAIAMAVVVLPRLSATFASLGGDLPTLTSRVLDAVTALRSGAGVVPALVIGSLAVAGALLLRRATGRWPLDLLPLVGRVRRDLRTTVALEVVASLLRGGVPFVEALDIAEGITADPPLRRRLGRVAREVRSGRPVVEAIADAGLVGGWVVEVLAVGERTGGLADAVARSAQVLGERTERRAQDLATVLEPLLLTLAGGLVGIVVLALYLPMFRVVDLVR
ncbi:MAG: hypothetical protein RLZZ272_282 [Actinomycetota bacterium]